VASVTHELSREFHDGLVRGIEELARLGYDATYFRRMIAAQGGVGAARRLVLNDSPSYGLVRLGEMERLELSIEARVLLPRYEELFDRRVREKATRKLRQFGCDIEATVRATEELWYSSAR
jgi:hypothetical protein